MNLVLFLKRWTLNLLFLAALLSPWSSAWAEVGVTVSPSRFRLSNPPGEAVPGTLTFRNSGTYPIQITTEITDMVTRENKQGLWVRDEAPSGSTPHSCARWIQILRGEGQIVAPGASATLEFVVSPPPEVQSGGYGAYLFVLAKPAEPPKPDTKGQPKVQFVTVPRLGVSVIYEVEGTLQRKGELLDLKFTPPTSTEPLKIRYGFRNTGNAEVVLTGDFHLLDDHELLQGKGSMAVLKTFPGEKAFAETVWDQSLPPGHYTLMLTLELGPEAEEVIVRELKFTVPESE